MSSENVSENVSEKAYDDIYIYDNDEKLLASGYLWNNNGDFIELRGSDFPLFDQGERVKARIEYRNGKSEKVSAYVYTSQEKYICLLVIYKIVLNNKRCYFRIKTNITTDITHKIIKNEAIQLDCPIKATVLNLCIGGMLIATESSLEANTLYKTSITLKDSMADVQFRILRRQNSEKWGNEYGCIFEKLSQQCEKDIWKYMFYLEKKKKDIVQNMGNL